jgi:hypothetical protein
MSAYVFERPEGVSLASERRLCDGLADARRTNDQGHRLDAAPRPAPFEGSLASQETHCFFLYSFIREALVCDCGIAIPELVFQVRCGGNCGGE